VQAALAHHAAQLAILFELQTAVAMASQDDSVVLFHRRTLCGRMLAVSGSGGTSSTAFCGQVLPASGA